MPLVNMKEMLQHAYENGYAVGAFDLINHDFLEGILDAAEACSAPVILSLAESHFDYFDFEQLMPAVEKAARSASVPVAIHLDHGESLESAIKAINCGCNGVMVDASHTPLEDNIQMTRNVVEMAHGCGVPVEGELGYVPGVEGEDAERHPRKVSYTTTEEARQFVETTGIDFLAVSIGTVHGRMRGEPKLDLERLREINQALRLPLVIHGGTGLSDDQYRRLIENGVVKINYYTALADAAGAAIRDSVAATESNDYTQLTRGVRTAVIREAERCIRLWGSAGRAAEVLSHCTPWLPVEHLIIYNVNGLDDEGAKAMMAKGRGVLAGIPGVLEVATGSAVKTDAAYRYTWLVQFCHPAVIDSYRDHPDHVAFADQLFRPVAGERISIDYEWIV
ncbi:MAG: ketose-bisphosphate aldolase [Candidatus Thiodiazotropha sp. (ex Ctena orbiculata)]|uniref:Ketose-bisphosphate aldolase n=1 Tax=Candidatus Thiodiazotropha taylori TaxID=2792791 RepID=A0A944M903_9GAMM|nr:ketose-bisphosphate aldolase [Candidatus Thiodiazotropha taylori]MBT2988419.1 ketose-bisphosphate aldolase [Candidatus Thiodiazotropha taylori]MBT2997326.1 ketose-bisphosphate aldolase [Candidatus Thiodiazotropha taylori]MBT3000964.1 ketose-bisphosphate aldolase [Candidatus Thiodiazotropha taylori]MBT3027783.1 ketose-bisphosphate aldolase [Candidatus Thiodiazotropha taylori]